MRAQDWYPGKIVLAGASYVGYTQWAVAARAGDDVVAMNPHVTSSRLIRSTLEGGVPQTDLVVRWGAMLHAQENAVAFARLLLGIGAGRVRRAMDAKPTTEGDRLAFGQQWQFMQDVLRRPVDDPHWDAGDFSATVGDIAIPASLYAGWYDIFLPDQLRDFAAMRAAGRDVRLTVGDFTHSALSGMAASLRETVTFSRERAGLQPVVERKPVRLRLMGTDTWREFDTWPPAATMTTWHLHAGGGLSENRPPEVSQDGATSLYRYDPADPTPTVGGRLLLKGAGRVDQRPRESRDDVLVFTSPPLAADLDVIGPLSATIWAESDVPFFDLHVRLCEVDERGRSFNVCDGIASLRCTPGAGPQPYAIALAPTAQRFARGRRIRVQVSSGSHPEYLRNAGGDPSRATATELVPALITIHHDRRHPSGVRLPHLS
ncbi:CocE/NonD family hydrolase [Flexivirga aerilata]|uniref:CocE/NonD family hydrolase n=1 Tax=Flexivirga aerilata TaxID=1656889 RepID=UPI003CCDDA1C